MPVAHGRVGNEHRLLRRQPVGHRLRALLLQELPCAGGGIGPGRGRAGRFQIRLGLRAALRLGMPVDGDIGDIGQDAGCPVAPRLELEQLRRLVDELGMILVVEEGRVLQQVLDKGDIGRDATDAELPQCPVDARNRGLGRGRPCRDLLQ